MNDDELRALVRDAVARHLGQRPGSSAAAPTRAQAYTAEPLHPSHVMYLMLVNEGDACVIEPSVACNHCGYCKSHGH